ncbi:MAG: oligopeptidase B, partial [Acidobacteria bacterium]
LQKRFLAVLLCLFALSALAGCSASSSGLSNGSQPKPPIAEKKPHETTVHGDTLKDNYFWLREKTNPQVMDYLKSEDSYAEAMMKPTAALQDKLYAEALSHIKQTDDTVAYESNSYFYYSRTREGLQYPIYCRKHGSLSAPEEVILD